MKLALARLSAILGILCSPFVNHAFGADLYLPNLSRQASGTNVSGKYSLDVYVAGGSLGGAASGAPYTLGDLGSLNLSVRKDSEGALAGVIDGDYTPLQVDANGRLKVDAALVEVATAADGGALPALTKLASGYDGTNVQVLKTDSTGSLQVDVESSALPTGAATEAKQDSQVTELQAVKTAVDGLEGSVDGVETLLGSIDTKLPTQGQKTEASSLPVVIASNQTAIPVSQSGTWNVTDISGTVSLPTGASTEATLSALNTKIPSNLTVTSNRLAVDGSGVTQPVSAASLPLPTGAATEANQTSANTKLDTIITQTARNTTGQITTAAEDVGTTAETQTAPAGAVAFLIQADDTNTANLRFAIGSTASATRGIQLQPGRSESLEVGADVSVISESGTQKYQIQWVIK